jgi:hypothetical protein
MRKGSYWGTWLLVVALGLQLWTGAAAAAGTAREKAPADAGEELAAAVEAAAKAVLGQEELSDWAAVGLAVSGHEVPEAYLAQVERTLSEREGRPMRVTDYERMALGVMAAGGDPTQIGGYDLIEAIVNHPNLTRQGANGVLFALLVLDAGGFEVSGTAAWNREALIMWLLKAQNEDGGWAIVPGEASSYDITAMAVTALAPYQGRYNVLNALIKAVGFLSQGQLENGGFPGDSAEVAAQVVIALTTLGLAPDDARFAKPGGNPLTYLLTLRRADGGFAHLPGEAESNPLASEQALMALAAVQRLEKGQSGRTGPTGIFHGLMPDVHVRVEGPRAPIASGEVKAATALQALERFFRIESIPYATVSYSFGTMIDTVDGIEGGMFGGWDGWIYAVRRGDTWIHPAVSIDAFRLEPGDRLVLFYSDNTKLVHAVETMPDAPVAGEPFVVKVTTSEWDWTANAEQVLPASGVRVTIGGRSAVTDADGLATFTGLAAGNYEVVVDGYAEGRAPSVVRTTRALAVSAAADRAVSP